MDHQHLKCYIVLLLLNDMTKESQEICERLAKANLTVHLMAGFNLPETCQWDEVCTLDSLQCIANTQKEVIL